MSWNCSKCTFINDAARLHCSICDNKRLVVKTEKKEGVVLDPLADHKDDFWICPNCSLCIPRINYSCLKRDCGYIRHVNVCCPLESCKAVLSTYIVGNKVTKESFSCNSCKKAYSMKEVSLQPQESTSSTRIIYKQMSIPKEEETVCKRPKENEFVCAFTERLEEMRRIHRNTLPEKERKEYDKQIKSHSGCLCNIVRKNCFASVPSSSWWEKRSKDATPLNHDEWIWSARCGKLETFKNGNPKDWFAARYSTTKETILHSIVKCHQHALLDYLISSQPYYVYELLRTTDCMLNLPSAFNAIEYNEVDAVTGRIIMDIHNMSNRVTSSLISHTTVRRIIYDHVKDMPIPVVIINCILDCMLDT